MQFYFKEHQHKSLPPNLQLALDSIKSKISNFLLSSVCQKLLQERPSGNDSELNGVDVSKKPVEIFSLRI